MRRTHAVSSSMLGLGVALLVAATTVGTASSATRAQRGGTLRVNQSAGAFDTLDPGLAYVTNDWEVLRSTQLLLVNYRDKAGIAGSQLFPEAARSFPATSNKGRTVTFHLRAGLRLSDGSPVTAVSFRRAWERILSPRMYAQYGLFDRLDTMVVGARDFADGHAQHIKGITAKGLTLTFHLTRPNATFVSILAMPWFGAVKRNMPYTRKSGGILEYPSGGPYYIARNRPARVLVLKRNPYYHGARLANPREIVINSYPNSNGEASLLQVEKNQVDFDLAGVPSADVAEVAQKYGYPSRHSRFHVGTQSCVIWEAFNASKAPTNNVDVRKALNYAIGRTPITRLYGPYAGKETDQLLPPGMPGYRKLRVYPNYPDFEKAEQVGGSALKNAPPISIFYTPSSAVRTSEAEFEQSQIERIGLTAKLVPFEDNGPSPFESTFDYNIVHSGYCGDYADPADLINRFFGGQSHQSGLDGWYLHDSSIIEKADRAASLTGRARARAYAALDRLLMVKYAPLFPLYVPNFRYLTSNRVHNIVFSHYLGYPLLNTMSAG
jgi:peptide/nickel transport system substrate-binding protein